MVEVSEATMFMARVLSYSWDKLLFVDETGSDSCNIVRKFV